MKAFALTGVASMLALVVSWAPKESSRPIRGDWPTPPPVLPAYQSPSLEGGALRDRELEAAVFGRTSIDVALPLEPSDTLR